MFNKIKKMFSTQATTEEIPQPETVNIVENMAEVPGALNYLDTAPEVVGYESVQDQNYIYELVSRLLSSNSIIDFGCGRGDFYSYRLRSTGQFVDYIGLESNPNLVESGKRLYGDAANIQNVNWFDPAFTDVKDWSVAITTLNTRYDSSSLSDEEYLMKTIDIMMQHCTVGSVLIVSSKFMPDNIRNSAPYTQNDPGDLTNNLIQKYGRVFVDHTFSNSSFLLYILK